jgi:hypothetical protein
MAPNRRNFAGLWPRLAPTQIAFSAIRRVNFSEYLGIRPVGQRCFRRKICLAAPSPKRKPARSTFVSVDTLSPVSDRPAIRGRLSEQKETKVTKKSELHITDAAPLQHPKFLVALLCRLLSSWAHFAVGWDSVRTNLFCVVGTESVSLPTYLFRPLPPRAAGTRVFLASTRFKNIHAPCQLAWQERKIANPPKN